MNQKCHDIAALDAPGAEKANSSLFMEGSLSQDSEVTFNISGEGQRILKSQRSGRPPISLD